jgi:hypothetical protein
MAFISVVVIRGGKNPIVVLFICNLALATGDVVPMPTLPNAAVVLPFIVRILLRLNKSTHLCTNRLYNRH